MDTGVAAKRLHQTLPYVYQPDSLRFNRVMGWVPPFMSNGWNLVTPYQLMATNWSLPDPSQSPPLSNADLWTLTPPPPNYVRRYNRATESAIPWVVRQ
jgi:hypothetical protein